METEETKKPKHGGARVGAGRKRMENGRNVRASFMLSTKAAEALERLATEQGTSRNDAINNLLERL